MKVLEAAAMKALEQTARWLIRIHAEKAVRWGMIDGLDVGNEGRDVGQALQLIKVLGESFPARDVRERVASWGMDSCDSRINWATSVAMDKWDAARVRR